MIHLFRNLFVCLLISMLVGVIYWHVRVGREQEHLWDRIGMYHALLAVAPLPLFLIVISDGTSTTSLLHVYLPLVIWHTFIPHSLCMSHLPLYLLATQSTPCLSLVFELLFVCKDRWKKEIENGSKKKSPWTNTMPTLNPIFLTFFHHRILNLQLTPKKNTFWMKFHKDFIQEQHSSSPNSSTQYHQQRFHSLHLHYRHVPWLVCTTI